MIPLVAVPVAPHTMLALLQYLQEAGSSLTPGDIADQAILGWLENRRAEAERPAAPVLRGYQWKCLFLPEGTRLRVWCRSEHGYAEVVGDKLMYKGRAVSPNQFVAACSDTVRNAWVEINVLMPGEKSWKLASVRRREIAAAAKLVHERQAQPPAPLATAGPVAPSSQGGHLMPSARCMPSMPPAPAKGVHGAVVEPEDDGFGNPLPPGWANPVGHGRPTGFGTPVSTALAAGYTEGRRGRIVDRRDPHAPLDRRDSY